jgi:hypothetical protein
MCDFAVSQDLERTKYVLRDYLRIRLWKLTQWPQHYLEPCAPPPPQPLPATILLRAQIALARYAVVFYELCWA